jgi:hypothetical protein
MFLAIFFLLFSFEGVFAADDAEVGTYEFYKQSVDRFCKPTNPELWNQWKDNSFLKNEQVFYADITKKDEGDAVYKAFLKGIESDPSKIDLIGLGLGPRFLEKASHVYKEAMGTIYACAVMNAKVRTINGLLANQSVRSNLKDKLTNQLKYTMSAMKTKCRTIEDKKEQSLKRSILDNTTYQYCNYRQYLYYLDSTSKNSLKAYYDTNKGTASGASNLLKNTDGAAMEISRSAGKIASEIAHVKVVFPQAMVAYTEFEKTYASHVILEFILQDYIGIRGTLKKLLNPIGQVIYKASNAQSPK